MKTLPKIRASLLLALLLTTGATKTFSDTEISKSIYSPPINGTLLDFDDAKMTSKLKFNDTHGKIEKEQLQVTFQAGAHYPNVVFPLPEGGWDLSAFAGVELDIYNGQDHDITAYIRVDNPGSHKQSPWNTQRVRIGGGESKVLKLMFGQDFGQPGFKVNSAQITGIQLFMIRPKEDINLLVSNLKAWGSPKDIVETSALTTPRDRSISVTPPEWLGKRPPIPGNWVQTLNENFDGDTLNTSIWTPRFPWDGPQPGQLQRYTPENVLVEDGKLKLISEKRKGHENNNPSLKTREFSSGLIQSYDKWAQRYGYFEARVKFPTARGLWPAFWLMPDRGAESGLNIWQRRDTGNQGMEIDIIEHLTEWGPGRNNVALHWDGYGDDHKSWSNNRIYFGPTPDGWHTFGVLWEPGKLTWYIDGKKVVAYENDRVSRVPAYIKLNTQIGGWATKDVDLSKLPDVYGVDYVRVWQRHDWAELTK